MWIWGRLDIFIIPLLWYVEMANGLLRPPRRKKITAAERKSALKTLESLHLVVDEESARAAFHRTSELAEKYGLTVYDAAYLEVALRRKSALQRAMCNSARRPGNAE